MSELRESPDRGRSWTTPEAIAARVRRLWDRGRILAASLGGEAVFPLAVPLARPTTRELSERFDEVRRWIRQLEDGSRTERSFGYEIEWVDIDHRQLGAQRVPRAALIRTEEDALRLIGALHQAHRFRALIEPTLRDLPELRAWIAKHPLVVIEHERAWERVVRFLAWMREHPRPGVYVRQVELPEIDTKFVEKRRGLLSDLLDLVLPSDAITTGTRDFEERYGFRPKPPSIRFRALDPRCGVSGLTDVSTPASQFAQLSLPVRRVFITENEINGLSFPELPDSIVVFGLGYGLERLAQVHWLRTTIVHYWGDLDTHGFAMLDRLRAFLPHARSLLMDRETLLAHRALWGEEPEASADPVERLTAPERAVYEDLKCHRLGERVRLEQERIPFAWVREAIRRETEFCAGATGSDVDDTRRATAR